MRGFLPILVIAGLVAVEPAQTQAQQQYPIWSDETTPINLMPGWPPIEQSRPTRGMFGARVLGQTLRPRDSASRFSSAGVVRGPSGEFLGIGSRVPRAPTVARTPPAYPPPAQAPLPGQAQPVPALPEQPLPAELRE